MANQKQETQDVLLKDDSAQNMAASLADLKSLFTSLQADVQSLKTSGQLQKDILINKDITDDIGTAEGQKAALHLANSKQLARDYDNIKMIAADEKDYALTTKFQRLAQAESSYYQYMKQQDQQFNAFMTHYTSEMSNERVAKALALGDERVQKSGIRTPEIQGGSAIGDK